MRSIHHVDVHDQALAHFGLRRDPFNWLPKKLTDFFYGKDMAFIEIALWRTIDLPGIMALIGEVGSGKSSAVRRFVEKDLSKKKQYAVSWVNVPQLRRIDMGHVLQQILFDFLDDFHTGMGMMKQAQTVRQLVDEFADDGVRPVVIVEDAHLMGIQPLRDLKLLYELHHRLHPNLAIILVGQPELRQKLQRQDLRQLDQRTRLHTTLGLTDDTITYVKHRVERVGGNTGDLFEPDALKELVAHPGISTPLEVNAMCAMALNYAWKQGAERITRELMFAVLSAHDDEASSPAIPVHKTASRSQGAETPKAKVKAA